ncbi:MAG: FKBP-type peptidyl-prolyl cis-trans isomerase [Chitinophagaceae bacterium]
MSVNLKNANEALSYYLGRDVGNNLKAIELPTFNQNAFIEGLTETLTSTKPDTHKNEEGRKILAAFFEKKQQEAIVKQQQMNKQFFADNAKQPGVVTLPTGLQYQVLQQGSGPNPTLQNTVKCMYKGHLLNGQVFDQSQTPVGFPVNGVIQGWQEGLQLMNVGSKYKFFIPSDLAYGERGAGNSIPPYSALIFEVELLEIQ